MNITIIRSLHFVILYFLFTIFVLIAVICPQYPTIAQTIKHPSSLPLSQSDVKQSVPPWIGVTTTDVTKEIANVLGLNDSAGALITYVTPKSPADIAGILGGNKTEIINGNEIKLGDVILEVDNKIVRDSRDFDIKLRNKEVGDNMRIKLFRDGQEKIINVIIDSMPDSRYENATIYKNPANVDFLSYESIRLGVEIQYPSGWQIVEDIRREEKYGFVLFKSNFENADDFDREYISLEMFPITNKTLYEILSLNISYADLKIVGPIVTTLADNPGQILVYNYTDNMRGEMKGMKIAMIKNDTAYIIRYLAQASKFEHYFSTIQHMVDSFKILNILPYDNIALGIRLIYSPNWKFYEERIPSSTNTLEEVDKILFIPASYNVINEIEHLEIIIDRRSAETQSLTSAVDQRIKLLQDNLIKFKLNDRSNSSNFKNIQPSYEINYSYGDPEYGIIKTKEILTMQNNKLYYITYYTAKEHQSKYLHIIDEIINSIKIYDTVHYSNIDLGFTLQYPSDWNKEEYLEDEYLEKSVVFSPPYNYTFNEWDFSEKNFAISVNTNFGKNNFEHLIKQIDDIKLIDAENPSYNFSMLKSDDKFGIKTSLDNTVDAYKIEFTYAKENSVYKTMQIYTMLDNDSKLYNITYTVEFENYDRYLPIIKEIIDYLKIIDFSYNEALSQTFNGIEIDHSFEIKYPDGWKPVEFNTGVSLWSPYEEYSDMFQEGLSITSLSSQSLHLSEIISQDFRYYRDNFDVLDIRTTKLTSMPDFSGTAVEYIYKDNEGRDLKNRIFYVAHKNSDYYLITYSAELEKYYKYLPTVDKMLESLQIKQRIEQKELNGFKVDKSPVAIAVNSDTNMLYVTNTNDDTVTVIDGDTNKIIKSIKVGSEPHVLSINQETNTIYVTNLGSNEVTVIDGTTNTEITNIPVGDSPTDIDVNSQYNMVYVADPTSKNVTVIDGSKNIAVANISLDDSPPKYKEGIGITVNEFDNTIYVTNPDQKEVKVIDGNTRAISDTISSFYFQQPIDIDVDPVIGKVYVVDSMAQAVFVIDVQTNEVIDIINTKVSPNDVAVNPNTNLVYVTNQLFDTVTEIDLSNDYSIDVDKEPFGVTVNPKTNIIYVTNYASNTITMIDGNTSQKSYGVTLNVNPSNSGQIECNTKQTDANTLILIHSNSQCEAKANAGYIFSTWSENLDSNSNRTITSTTTEPKTLFSFFSSLFSNPANSKLEVNEHGNFTANFVKTEEIKIPDQYWAALFSVIPAFFIPSILRWIAGNRKIKTQLSRQSKYRIEIDDIYKNFHHKREICLQELDNLRTKVTEEFEQGKINDIHYGILNNKISNYEKSLGKP